MSLSARIGVERERFRLSVDLDVAPGEVLALLGPNGAGKTTALRALAGLLPLSSGVIELDGQPLDAPGAGVFVATERRPVGMVFQDYLLFPHLSALENIAFGPRARGMSRREARAAAAAWLERVGLSGFAGSHPRELSGGQAQRVALARALVTGPRMLLLDEPLAALDATTRLEIRSQLRRHLADFAGTTVLVTHDPLDAMVLADRLVVLEDGAVVQAGTPGAIARAPRTDYVARLVGLNLYRGTCEGRVVSLHGGGSLHVAEAMSGEVFVAFPPSAVALHREAPRPGSPRNVWRGLIDGVEQHGDVVRVRLEGTPPVLADVTTAAVADLDLAPGVVAWAVLKATEARAYPA